MALRMGHSDLIFLTESCFMIIKGYGLQSKAGQDQNLGYENLIKFLQPNEFTFFELELAQNSFATQRNHQINFRVSIQQPKLSYLQNQKYHRSIHLSFLPS